TTVPKAAVCCNVPKKNTYTIFKEFNASNDNVLLGFSPKATNRGTKKKPCPQHTFFFF
ncbi:hypothetical protein J3Q64DRAFT_1620231, partial [Phycomyces blakesleeanus]